MRTRAVIFDMDGVLVDTEPIYIDIGRASAQKTGIEMSQERMMSYVGVPAKRMWAEIRRDFLFVPIPRRACSRREGGAVAAPERNEDSSTHGRSGAPS